MNVLLLAVPLPTGVRHPINMSSPALKKPTFFSVGENVPDVVTSPTLCGSAVRENVQVWPQPHTNRDPPAETH